jgi:hypothetical protein
MQALDFHIAEKGNGMFGHPTGGLTDLLNTTRDARICFSSMRPCSRLLKTGILRDGMAASADPRAPSPGSISIHQQRVCDEELDAKKRYQAGLPDLPITDDGDVVSRVLVYEASHSTLIQ